MRVELISTGTELLLGEIVNTSVVYLSERLNELGYSVLYQTVVGDNEERMKEVYSVALKRADIVITTGGLGPTEGDITKHVMADLLGLKMELRENCKKQLEALFARRNQKMTLNNLRQATMPAGAIDLENDHGTAPGVWIETVDGKIVVQLPGPPFEMKKMFELQVKDRLTARYGELGQIASLNLHTVGIGESTIAEQMHDLITAQSNPTIALLSSKKNLGMRIRLTAKADNFDQAMDLIRPLEQEIRNRFGEYIWGVDQETLPEKVSELLKSHGETVATAESCTGGFLGYRLTEVAGSSEYYLGGAICYSNEAKMRECNVAAETLATYGAVSEETAGELAKGIRERFDSDWGIGITGISGPDGGTDEKKVGLVFVGFSHRTSEKPEVVRYLFNGDRDQNRQRATQSGLFHFLKKLKEHNVVK